MHAATPGGGTRRVNQAKGCLAREREKKNNRVGGCHGSLYGGLLVAGLDKGRRLDRTRGRCYIPMTHCEEAGKDRSLVYVKTLVRRALCVVAPRHEVEEILLVMSSSTRRMSSMLGFHCKKMWRECLMSSFFFSAIYNLSGLLRP